MAMLGIINNKGKNFFMRIIISQKRHYSNPRIFVLNIVANEKKSDIMRSIGGIAQLVRAVES